MNLAELLHPWIKINQLDCEILGIDNDSRRIKAGYLFIAYPGDASDGRLYIPQAVNAGAVAIVYEPDNWPSGCSLPAGLLAIAFPGIKTKLAAIASRFYDYPAKKLIITGVTGTNGKTTIAYQLAQAHALLGQPAAYIGTLGQGEVPALKSLMNTTPDALCLQGLLFDYQKNHIKHVEMEVSSHALCQQRVNEIDFDYAIFTNLTHDHLDYHHTMQAYAAAKASLFAYSSLKSAIINYDDSYSSIMRAAVKSSCQLISYGMEKDADVRVLHKEISLLGTHLEVDSPWGIHQFSINALGFFNIYNALAVFSCLLVNGYAVEQVIAVMQQLQAAPGRMEIVSQEPYVIVDYAHTPDALENVLITLTAVKKGRILVVFGCGGDRDKTKRSIMGRIAGHYGDVVIITSDNPRHEEPQSIIEDITQGIQASSCYKILNREEAIAKAMSLADKEDIVLIAGKGHESYQQIGDVRHAFSDQEVVKRLTNRAL